MDTAHSEPEQTLHEIRTILEQDFACDLTGISLEPSLPLGHDGLGLDSLMLTDLLVRWGGRHATDPAPALFENLGQVTVGDLLEMA